jgi:hypothetical protein
MKNAIPKPVSEKILREIAARAGIQFKPGSIRPNMTALFRTLAPGEVCRAKFTGATAPYGFARLAGIKIKCEVIMRQSDGLVIEATRIN